VRIQPIVEGHGEIAAVPILLRRLRDEAGIFGIDVLRPIRQKRSQLVQKSTLQRAVQLARLQPECAAILILFDADDDCPKDLAPQLTEWAREAAGSLPCHLVMAVREYEAWFLAAMESLRGQSGIESDADSVGGPESIRGAKEAVERNVGKGFSYMETTNQPAFTAMFDMQMAFRKCRSFRKMAAAFGELIRESGTGLSSWPPSHWTQGAS
jgi:hypothetical protein